MKMMIVKDMVKANLTMVMAMVKVTDIGVDVGLEDATAMVMEEVAMATEKENLILIMAMEKVNMATEKENMATEKENMVTVETIIRILLIESASTNSQTF